MRTLVRKFIGVVTVVVFWQFSGVPQTPKAKPLVAVIYADRCPLCQKLKPVLARINERYHGKIRFVRLDVTSEKTAAEAKLEAHNAGLESFFDENKERTSLVIIQDTSGHEIFKAYHDYDFQHYTQVLDQQLRTTQK